MKLIIVSGPWSSGTTAVAGALAHLGYMGFGPYLQILVARPLAEIERTRLRRNWHVQHGAAVEKAIPTQVIHYAHMLGRPEPVIRAIAQFCGYAASAGQITLATRFIEDSAAFKALSG